jgi:hypothetical protein
LPISDSHVSGIWGAVSVPLKYLWAECIFRPRVLDAWVKSNLHNAAQGFSDKQTVKDRQIHVPVALFVDGHLITELKPEHLRDTFKRNHSRLMISGAGGAGVSDCILGN